MTKQKFVFAGTGLFAVPCLSALATISDNLLVISQHLRPSGKKRLVKPSPLYEAAQKLNLKVLTPERIDELGDLLNSLRPDLLMVADFGQIISDNILKIPKYGAINVHPSLLPKHRGPAPISAAILNNDTTTGVSLILMDAKMDHGPIIAQQSISMHEKETALELEQNLSKLAAAMVIKYIPAFLAGKIKPQEQNHEQATYHKLIKRTDGEILWNESAVVIERKWRAYYPWPGIWCHQSINKQEKIIKFLNLELLPSFKLALATGAFFWKNNILGIVTADGLLKINKLQVEGKKSLNAEQFFRGYHDIITQLS